MSFPISPTARRFSPPARALPRAEDLFAQVIDSARRDGAEVVFFVWRKPPTGAHHNPSFVNCIFVGNSVGADSLSFSAGSAVVVIDSSPQFVNCSFTQNVTGNTRGAALYTVTGSPRVTNCILWSNRNYDGTRSSAQVGTKTGSPAINHCCVQSLSNSVGGVGNIDKDLQEADPLGAATETVPV